MELREELKSRASYFEGELERFCSSQDACIPARLREAMDYSLLAGGKRLRPVLCMAGAELFGADRSSVLPMALAFEMVHTASLIHDDLPCMDNDTLRRGKPTNHVVYGETLALLAGDALFLYAFETALGGLLQNGTDPKRALDAVNLFSQALGPSGICGGQVLDTDEASREDRETFVTDIASMKTMVLIRAALCSGAILAGAAGEELERLMEYGRCVGIAFQVADDILDVVGTQAEMGKTLGKDAEQDKRTFVLVHGLDGARKLLHELTQTAVSQLDIFGGKAEFLRELALYLENRTR
ncbi:MAG: polyprenyl synthetase family protein [Pyramidobacter sp.]|nr:polyprenyl synthetase family protein [Pyramidobacter sp.]